MKPYIFKKRHIFYLIIFLFINYLHFVFFMTDIYRQCFDGKCVSVARLTQGRDTFLRVYDQKLYTTLFNNFYNHAQYPLETGVLIGKQTQNDKIVVISDVLPTRKGDLSNHLIFKEQTNAYYTDNPNAIAFDKLPHF